jgi:hypothetical protein
MENEKGILPTPDYAGLFRQFLRDASNSGMRLPENIASMHMPQDELCLILRLIQSVIAPLCIALQAATSVTEIESLRSVFTDILAHLNQKAGEYENESEPEGSH